MSTSRYDPDFRFTVNGRAMSVHELQPGMTGTATITTRTRTTPVTVTEVKNGQVLMTTGGNIYVRTDGDAPRRCVDWKLPPRK